MPDLIERYQAYRTRRFLATEQKYRRWFPNWRNQSRRRLLVLILAATFAAMLGVGIVCHFNMKWGPLLWLPACAVFFPTLTVLQIVSGRQGDAPAGTLDEFEIEQRNSARSIGLTVTQTLVTLAAVYLIFGSVLTYSDTGGDHLNLAYAGGLFVITTLLIGGCTPAMILAWSRPDFDAEDEAESDTVSDTAEMD